MKLMKNLIESYRKNFDALESDAKENRSDYVHEKMEYMENNMLSEYNEWAWDMYEKYGGEPHTKEGWYQFEERLHSGEYDEEVYPSLSKYNPKSS